MLFALIAGFALLAAAVAALAFHSYARARELERAIAALTARVYELECRPQGSAPPAQVEATSVEEPALTAAASEGPILEPRPARDWEAIIGGNWLNKIGALVLVVGIGLFLAYSLAHLGPGGKVAIGYAVGLSMLAGGVVLESRPEYATFSRGLIGGGWAAVYFTTYAMHGLPAARVIESPVLGTALLIAVSAGMVLHSLRYRSEPATVLAYFISFAALNSTPLTGFTVVGSLFLALSLMAAAYRFTWHRLAVAGVLFTYGTFAVTYEPAVYGRAGLLNGQSILWIYWIVFEAYDLVDIARRPASRGIERALFLLNATGFIGATVLHEWQMNTRDWALYFSLAAAAYLASGLLRGRLVPLREEDPLAARALSGGYEGAAIASALLAAAAIVQRFSGIAMTTGLFVEAEMIVLAGFAARDRFLRTLGGALFALPLLRLGIDYVSGERWAPVATAMGAAFYLNHLMLGRGWLYPAAGSLLLAFVTGSELPVSWIAPVWGVGLIALALIAWRTSRADLVMQAYALAFVLTAHAFIYRGDMPDFLPRLVSEAAAVASVYAAYGILRGARERLHMTSIPGDPRVLLILGTLLLAGVLEEEVRTNLVTLSWALFAAALVSAGFTFRDRSARLTGLAVFLLCLARLFLYDIRQLDTFSRILSFIVLGLTFLGASWVYTRYREQIRRIL